MLLTHLKLALRTLRRRTSYTLINGAGFVVGITCCVLIALFLQYERSYDRYLDDSEDVHRVLRQKRANWWSTIPFPRYEEASTTEQNRLPQALTEQLPQVEAATNFYVGPHGRESVAFVERGDRRFAQNDLLYTTTGDAFFAVFPFPFLRGTPEDAFASPGTAVLTRSAAQRYFGALDVIGKRLTLATEDDQTEVTVTGVIEDVPTTSHFTFGMAVHVDRIRNWGAFTYLRLRDGASAGGLDSAVERVMNEARPQRVEDPLLRSVLGGVRLQALHDIHLGPRMLYDPQAHRDSRYLWAFGAIGLLILTIVVINYTNLAVALSTERRREIGVRKATGARQGEIVGQFLTEAAVLTLACVPAVVGALEVAVPVFNDVMDTQLRTAVWMSPQILGGLVGLALAVGLCAGAYPAFVLSRLKAVSLFRDGIGGSGTRQWSIRHLLIGVQFALLVGLGGLTWLVNSQLHFLQTKDLGFQTQGVIELTRVNRASTYQELRNRLRDAPEIAAMGAGIGPGPGRFHVTFRAADSDRVHSNGDLMTVDPGWFETLGIDHPTVTSMASAGHTAPTRLLANRAAVSALATDTSRQGPGQTVVFAPESRSPDRAQVDGIVENFYFRPLYERVQPLFLRVESQPEAVRSVLVRFAPGMIDAGLDRLRIAWSSIRPNTPFAASFVDEQMAQLYAEERRIGRLGVALTGVALLLAALGLVGLAAYVTRRRTKEIGIRKALGATVGQIVALLNREFAVLVVIATLVAAPVAYLTAQSWLQSFAYHVDAHPLIFVAAGVGAAFVAVAAASYQAWHAGRIDPADALRQE